MQLPDDYYQILGVSTDASSEEITRAFRRLAKQFHPDVNKTAWAEEFFKKINEAYQTLSDPLQKAKYDISHRYVKINQTKSGATHQTNSSAQAKSKPQSNTKSNSYAYTNTKSTNYYSYDPSKSKSQQSTNSQQNKSNNARTSYGRGQYYASQGSYTIPKENTNGLKGLVIIIAVLSLLYIIAKNYSDSSTNSDSSGSYASHNDYIQSTVTKIPTPKTTQTKKPDAIADGLDVTFHDFIRDFNAVYKTKLVGGIDSYRTSNYPKAYVNKNSQLFFTKNLKSSIHTVVLYLSFDANNAEELDNIGMSVVSLVQAAIPDHAFTKAEQNDAFDQIIEKGDVYKYGKVIISIEAWDQTGVKDKVWIVARKINEYSQYGVFDLPKSADGYSIEDLLFNGQSQIYGTEFSGFYLSSNGNYFENNTFQKTTHVPLKKKTGGYTETELIMAGYIGKKIFDGTMFYEGFYIAPNGNYYPVEKNIPTVAPEERRRLENEYWEYSYP